MIARKSFARGLQTHFNILSQIQNIALTCHNFGVQWNIEHRSSVILSDFI